MRFWATALLLAATGTSHAGEGLTYVQAVAGGEKVVIVDCRERSRCQERSLAGARCIPAGDLAGPQGELPSFRDLLWLLGTAGLSGRETVLVAGDEPLARDFVAGVLFLSGQHRVQVLQGRLSEMLRDPRHATGPGRIRGMLREPIYRASVREERIVLAGELRRMLSRGDDLVAVDGRADGGVPSRAAARTVERIPGAVRMPLRQLYRQPLAEAGSPSRPVPHVAYGYGARESIALLTYLTATTDADVRVLLNGWRGWLQTAAASQGRIDRPASNAAFVTWVLVAVLALILLAGAARLRTASSTRKDSDGLDVSGHHG